MQKDRSRRAGIGLIRGVSRILLALTAVIGSLAASLLALGVLMRQKAVNDTMRRVSSRMDKWPLIRRMAGTRFGSLYFNLAVVGHVGRRSGRAYETFLSAYPLGDGFVLTLAYPHTDWCSNILAAGRCTVTVKGRTYALERPELIPVSQAWAAYPPIAKVFVLAGGEQQCLWVHRKPVTTSRSPGQECSPPAAAETGP
jgi:deazaflavin-dependent oxidoreductase (nitroreductase family)